MDLWLQILSWCLVIAFLAFTIWYNPNEIVYKEKPKEKDEEKEIKIVADEPMSIEHANILFETKFFTEKEKELYERLEKEYKKTVKEIKYFEKKFKTVLNGKLKHRELYDLALEYKNDRPKVFKDKKDYEIKDIVKEEDYFEYCEQKTYAKHVGYIHFYNINLYLETIRYIDENPYWKYVKEYNETLLSKVIKQKLHERYYYSVDLEKEYNYLNEVLEKFVFTEEE